MYILAGDIGGTHSRLVLAEYHDASWKILAEQHYPSSAYPDLISVIDTFITEHHISVPVDAACLAVAGPVVAGVARITNLPWSIEEKQLAEKLGAAKVRLVNDFYAVASGIAVLNAEDFAVLQHGDDKQGVAKPADAAVLGAGTGLGICHLVRQDNSFNIYPSEAGHAGFAPENKRQRELLGWLQESHEHVSQEMLLSGPGLLRIYDYLYQVENLPASESVTRAMQSDDAAKVITQQAFQGDALCETTLQCFVDIYGAAAGNVALHYYPVGELYIAGGIAPRLGQFMTDGRFIRAFNNKGPMQTVMKSITVKLILQDRVGLFGAISCAAALD